MPPRRRIDRPDATLPRPPLPALNSSKTEIFLQIRERGLLKAPNLMKAPRELTDHSKYCQFHYDYGHNTEECCDLKNQTEELIRRGHLGHYIRRPCKRSPYPSRPVEKQTDMISGSPTAGGDNMVGRKAYAQAAIEKSLRQPQVPEITFSTRETEYPEHDDALVILARIANARVKRIMVDTGSSANILYFGDFQKLSLTKEDLAPSQSALTRFTGDSISSLSTTVLPVTLGEGP
ncbi:uncharacterized protein LOC135642891 [Musa acuminata AAA Group]|uniref:uncharacterized protein LOC135642891 n=1 Tax=Musa acuminata AAA Group TaxID=214697 RepID=UPI0031E1C0DD